MAETTSDLPVVAISYSLSESMVIVSMLRWYGIDASVQSYGTLNLRPGLILALGGLPIVVPRDDFDAARTLLIEGERNVDSDSIACQRPAFFGVMRAILMFVFGGSAPPPRMPLRL